MRPQKEKEDDGVLAVRDGVRPPEHGAGHASDDVRPVTAPDARRGEDRPAPFTDAEVAISRPPPSTTSGQTASPSSDRDLVARIGAGDVGAFEELYRLHAAELLGYARSRLRSREDAEDIVQELFLSLWRHRSQWNLDRSVRSYLFGALRNHIVSHRRSIQAREGRLNRVGDAENSLAALASASCADHKVREAELTQAIEQAIGDLSPRCQETFLLVRRQGLSYAEAAEVLDISVKGVEMNMVRALASLRKQLAHWQP